MVKSILLGFIISFVFQACTQKGFVQRSSQVDLLPQFLPKDSIRIINPIFSGNKVMGDKIEWSFPVSIQTENSFKKNICLLLDSLNIHIKDTFVKTGSCLTNKMHAENWLDYKWNIASTYSCLKNDPNYYTVFLYNMLEVWEGSGTTITSNENSYIHSFIKVFYKNRIVYKKSYMYKKRLTNKEQKGYETSSVYPFFKEDQIKHVVQKITEDLFKRIQPK